MDPPEPSNWPGLILAAMLVLLVGGQIASAKNSVIFEVLGDIPKLIVPALNGEPGAVIAVIVLGWTALFVFIAIPGRLGLFRMLAPD